jgi:hypothetical protein
VERARVDSSSIASIGYDPGRQALEIEFVNGGVYEYQDVPVEELERLVTSDSLGRYLNRHIKPNYRAVRVKAAED